MMIEKNENILRDSRIKRIVEYSADSKQINILDTRFYKRDNKFYPSVTSILNYFPKNQYFYGWLKDVGHNAEFIANKAGNEGTQVHNAIDAMLRGEELEWLDEYGKAKYNLEVWKMILKFGEFWNKAKPKLITTEYHLFSDKYQFAGTADLIVEMEGKIWLLDIKTSNSLHVSYNLQLAAYAQAWNESHNKPIEETGIIWLKANTTKEPKDGRMHGKGWQLKVVSDIEKNLDMFTKIHDIYRMENPKMKPYSETIPTTMKLIIE